MSVYFDEDKKRWRFQFNRVINGERTRATKLLPQGWGAARRDKYDRDETARLYAVAAGIERPEATIAQAVALYLDERVPKLANKKKVAQDLAHLVQPVDYINGRPVSQFPDLAAEYVKDHPELSDGTLHNRLAYLKAAGRYSWKRKRKLFGPADPTAGMVIPHPHNTKDVQTPIPKLLQLLSKIKDLECRAIFFLAFRTGSRWRKEIRTRKPEHVTRVGRDVWLNVGVTKNGQPDMKWVHPDARWALRYLPFKHDPTYYYKRFRAARKAVGMEDHVAHDMRHILATDIRRRGGSLSDVGAALSHRSHQSSQRYAHISAAQVKRVLAAVQAKKMHTRRADGRRRNVA